MSFIEYEGIKTNNLKDINVKIQKNSITSITGVSGSGKSSLAFNTIYGISRNELNKLYGYDSFYNKFSVRKYNNIIPAVALEQNNFNRNPRSTIATYYNIDSFFSKTISYFNNVPINIFSFNKYNSSCNKCNGLGYEFSPDVRKIIDYDLDIKEVPFKNWKKSGINYYQQLLIEYCSDNNIDINKNLRESDEETKKNLMNGISLKKYKINFKQGERKRIKTDYYRGPVPYIIEKINKNKLSQSDMKFVKRITCSSCNGFRFSKKVLKYQIFDKNLGEIYTMQLDKLKEWIVSYHEIWDNDDNCRNSFLAILNFVEELINLELSYLNLNRSINSLSGGELQRLQLSQIMNTQFDNILYVLDEPSSSLHASEYETIYNKLKSIAEHNTVLLVEHNPYFVNISDNIITLGPGSGKKGGEIIESSSYIDINNYYNIECYKFFKTDSFINIENEEYNNIKNFSTKFPINSIIGICGVSGSGKSSFVSGILPKYVEKLIYTGQKPINGNSYSIIATYLEIITNIRKLYANENNVDENLFSFYANSKGACKDCNGKGYVTYQLKLEDTVSYVCPQCDGKRFNKDSLKYSFNDLDIYQFLNKTVDELIIMFEGRNYVFFDTLLTMQKVGLGYINIFQSVYTLSGGEAQRLKLVKKLKNNYKNKFIVLDEPFKGLHLNNIINIIQFLYELVEKDCTVVIIEHNYFALSHCSYLVEFGPGSGVYGGELIYNGTKEGIKNCENSKTSSFLL